MKKGSVVFVMHHDSKLSRLIAWFMRSKWSHSALIVDNSPSETWLSETTDTQIAHGRLSSYLTDPRCSVEILEPVGVSDDEIAAGVAEAENNGGQIYAYWQLLSLALVCLGERIGLDLPNLLPYGFVCNSHVLDGVRLYTIPPLHSINPRSIHTGRMYAIMKSSVRWRTVLEKAQENF